MLSSESKRNKFTIVSIDSLRKQKNRVIRYNNCWYWLYINRTDIKNPYRGTIHRDSIIYHIKNKTPHMISIPKKSWVGIITKNKT